ncbi:MAG: alkene reductase [Pseudomonadota bacterium]
MSFLFKPLTLGSLELPNRIIMAPLTRCRVDNADFVPTSLMRDYYVQRSSAGLIISEATVVSPMGIGYPNTPGIWSSKQVEGWKAITDAVHEAGGRIFLQLWHVGRFSDPIYLNGALPIAPSAIAPLGHIRLVRPVRSYGIPRALESDEIPAIIEAFRKGAENAYLAGFDGVEIHGANGYLLDQFLQDNANHRTDRYGGSIENRARLMLEVVDAAISIWGASSVGIHLAPRCDSHSMGDSNPKATFGYLAQELGKRALAFICARECLGEDRLGPYIKKNFGGIYIANEKFNQQTAEQLLASGEADAVAFGKAFIANPDLPLRLKHQATLNAPDPATFYTQGSKGYTDYPFLAS